MTPTRFAAIAGGALLIALLGSPTVADVISDWNTAVVPPPPELREVTIHCTPRPRCVAAVPNMVVWYSLVGSNGKATPDDITLKQAGIKTVVICGNSFQGATVGTASGAAQRGYKVIVPVDCSAGNTRRFISPRAVPLGLPATSR
jgi:nicotinamidase-related amidase